MSKLHEMYMFVDHFRLVYIILLFDSINIAADPSVGRYELVVE